ncbi:Fc.00g098660.m01.CDS01 [Cosmosporella sp. VM-42]
MEHPAQGISPLPQVCFFSPNPVTFARREAHSSPFAWASLAVAKELGKQDLRPDPNTKRRNNKGRGIDGVLGYKVEFELMYAVSKELSCTGAKDWTSKVLWSKETSGWCHVA